MTVTRDVILDLLPLYLAGEASQDTRTLVDEYLATDPALARLMRMPMPDLAVDRSTKAPADLGTTTLHRTRMLLWLRTLFLGFAVLFSLIPLIPNWSRLRLLIYPPAMSVWAAAIACWIGFLIVIRRLRLPPAL